MAMGKLMEFGGLEVTDPVDPAPAMFDRIRVPCSTCGGILIGEEYAFFPSSVFIRGTCLKCGDTRCAIFAPAMQETEGERTTRIAAELQGFSQDLARQYKEDEDVVIADFLAYLSEKRSA